MDRGENWYRVLKGNLEELGYHTEPGYVGVRVTGDAHNPDPTYEELNKITNQAIKDLNMYVEDVEILRMSHDEVW